MKDAESPFFMKYWKPMLIYSQICYLGSLSQVNAGFLLLLLYNYEPLRAVPPRSLCLPGSQYLRPWLNYSCDKLSKEGARVLVWQYFSAIEKKLLSDKCLNLKLTLWIIFCRHLITTSDFPICFGSLNSEIIYLLLKEHFSAMSQFLLL